VITFSFNARLMKTIIPSVGNALEKTSQVTVYSIKFAFASFNTFKAQLTARKDIGTGKTLV